VEVVEQMPIIKEEDSWSFIIVGEFTARSMYSYLYNKLYLLSSFGVNSIEIVAKVWGELGSVESHSFFLASVTCKTSYEIKFKLKRCI
jgi:hypothetical protein